MKKTASLAGSLTLVLLLTLPIVLCWLFGGVDGWAQIVAFSLLIVATGAWAVALLCRGAPFRASAAAFLLFGAICFGFLQVLYVPTSVISFLSPTATELRLSLTNQLTGSSTLSLSAVLTRRTTSLLIMATAAFLISSSLFARSAHLRLLFWGLALNGAALAAFGLAQEMTWNGKLFWSVPTGGSPFASFVNKNNAAGFLNLSLAAALGAVVDSWRRSRAPTRLPLTIRQNALRVIAGLTAPKLLALALAICIGGR